MKWTRRVILVLIVLLLAAIALGLTTSTSDRYYNSHKAIAQSREILGACKAYHKHPEAGKKYPSNLVDLVTPPFGGSYLRNGGQDLLDPWGKPYRYALVRTEQGETELYVWTERTVDGKLKLLGAKLTGVKIEMFGLPE